MKGVAETCLPGLQVIRLPFQVSTNNSNNNTKSDCSDARIDAKQTISYIPMT